MKRSPDDSLQALKDPPNELSTHNIGDQNGIESSSSVQEGNNSLSSQNGFPNEEVFGSYPAAGATGTVNLSNSTQMGVPQKRSAQQSKIIGKRETLISEQEQKMPSKRINDKDTNSFDSKAGKAENEGIPFEDVVVDILSKDPALISMVKERMEAIMLSNQNFSRKTPPPSDTISRSVVQAILTSSVSQPTVPLAASTASAASAASAVASTKQPPQHQPLQAHIHRASTSSKVSKKQTSRLRAASRSRSHSPSIHQSNFSNHPPVKTVSFSSISTPHYHSEEDGEDNDYASLRRQQLLSTRTRSLSRSPPPSPPVSLPSSPVISHRPHVSSSSNSNGGLCTGETTASGDSSVSSTHHHFFSSANIPTPPSSQQVVHFSAINPNPQLILDHNEENPNNSEQHLEQRTQPSENEYEDPEQQRQHATTSSSRVTFILDRAVSFEDQSINNRNNDNNSASGSRASYRSRSGLSSPSFEPSLSPPISNRSSSPHRIQFNNTIETITEAAERLRREQDGNEDDENGNNGDTQNPPSLHSTMPQGIRENRRNMSRERRSGSRDRSSSSRGGSSSSRVVHFSAIRREAF